MAYQQPQRQHENQAQQTRHLPLPDFRIDLSSQQLVGDRRRIHVRRHSIRVALILDVFNNAFDG